MRFSIASGPLETIATGCIVVGVHEGRALSPAALDLDAASGRTLGAVVRRDFPGKLATTLLLQGLPGAAAERVLLVGLGPREEFHESRYRAGLCCAMEAVRTTSATDVTVCLDGFPVPDRDADWKIEHAVLAAMEGLYRFDKLKTEPEETIALQCVTLHTAGEGSGRSAVDRAAAIAEGIVFAKDLGNLPGNVCDPGYLADQAVELGNRHGFDVTVLDREEIRKLGMGGFLAVARGSRQPPKFIVMEYRGGAREEPPVVLVGKGLTFDAGGICIKPALEMDEMKFDMCGAASVLGAMHAAALMKLPLNVVAIIAAAENMPGGNASKPGDVVVTLSGRTVEILDTDAEGRVVLCDALTYAERFGPAAVIDVGTLTGGIVVSLGDVATGMFANDERLAREVERAADRAWDRVWQMPLWDDYQEGLKSNFADLPNMGTRGSDCAITAACFLSRFARRFPWVHLDIAGTASRGGADKGATGRPVALLAHFLLARAGR
ncbi:MAG TPA: leucyl aminopeptidase [Terriglobales bacterium]|nr:leucyl aminopeptidase [Terriglobales bacterium]